MESILSKQRAFFHTGATRPLAYRLNALERLRIAIQDNEQKIIQALREDLNKSEFEAYSTEIGVVLSEIRFTIRHLQKWMKPVRVKTPMTHIGSKSFIYNEPYGCALIIAPWNYPFQLAIAPLIGAIAAGNCSVVKPSELTPSTSSVVRSLIESCFSEEFAAVVEGGVETSQALLDNPFDTVFFTGSVPVGRIVMEKAAKHLTPVTLELGGKSPCIVHRDADIRLAAKRVAWGKWTNAGQTCIAPDYVYVHESIRGAFQDALEQAIHDLYGPKPIENPNYVRIVSGRHFERLVSFLDNGACAFGGSVNRDKLLMEPTVLTNVTWDDAVMQEEIFGPILPVFTYQSIDDVITAVTSQPKPLALYLFTGDKATQDKVLERVSFGGGCINDTMYHFVSPYLPFGGVGNSGIGGYHGKASFDTFSHPKSVVKQTMRFDIPFRYPNAKNGLKRIKAFLK